MLPGATGAADPSTLSLPGLFVQLLDGLGVTVLVTVGAAVLAVVVAVVAALVRMSRVWPFNWCAVLYIETFRGTSALVQLFWVFFALPLLLGISLDPIIAGILVLGLNIGSYGAEVVRGAIRAVPKGQTDAATALNMTPLQRMRHVILPQAALAMIPPWGNLMIELLKATALVSLITLTDLTRRGQEIREAGQAATLEIYAVLLAMYFGLSLLITWGARTLERRLARGRDHGGVR